MDYARDEKISDTWKKYHSLYILGIVSHAEYAIYRNKVTALSRKQKISYYEHCFSRNANNMKALWNIIRKLCFGHQIKSIDAIKSNDDTLYDDMQIKSTSTTFLLILLPTLLVICHHHLIIYMPLFPAIM